MQILVLIALTGQPPDAAYREHCVWLLWCSPPAMFMTDWAGVITQGCETRLPGLRAAGAGCGDRKATLQGCEPHGSPFLL